MSIQIGSDELILNIRKNYEHNNIDNKVLGKRIWHWIRENDASASKDREDVRCHWGDEGLFVSPTNLPQTAAQFTINEEILPSLYLFLNELGDSNS